MTNRLLVLYTESLAQEPLTWLSARCDVIQCDPSDARFEELLQRAHGLIVRTYLNVDEALIARAPHLRVVGRAGIGIDNIDVHACRMRGIEVVYTPQASTESVVEYVIGLTLDAIRPRPVMKNFVDAKQWSTLRKIHVGKKQLDECTVGILGFGRIGSRLAQVLAPFHIRVIYNDLVEIASENRFGATPVAVDELFADSDIISVHIDGRTENYHFVGEKLLSHMKPDAVFINTSRGSVVDAKALAMAMGERPDAKAMIDVHEQEPFDKSYPLLDMPNVFLYPHLASRTDKGLLNMSWVVRDIAAVLEGRKPEFPAP